MNASSTQTGATPVTGKQDSVNVLTTAPDTRKPKIAAAAAILAVGIALGVGGTMVFQSLTDSGPEPLRQVSLVPAAGNTTGTIEEICGSDVAAPLTQDGTATVGSLRVSTRWTPETATISFANEYNALVSADVISAVALESAPGEFRVARLTSQEKSAYSLLISNPDWGPMSGRTLYICK